MRGKFRNRRAVSILLCLIMILTWVPLMPLSAEGENGGEPTKYDNPWNYAVFADSIEFPMFYRSGSSVNINGDIHANNDVRAFTKTFDAGTVEAGGEVDTAPALTTVESAVEDAKNIPLPHIYYSITALEGNKARANISQDTSAEDMLRTSVISDEDINIDLTGSYPADMQIYTKKAGVFSAAFLTKMYENGDKWNDVLPAFTDEAESDDDGKISITDLIDNSFFAATQEETVDQTKYTNVDRLPGTTFMDNLNIGGYISSYIDEISSDMPSDLSDYQTLANGGINPNDAQNKIKLYIPNNMDVTLEGDYNDLEELYIDSYNGIQLIGNFPKLKHIYAANGAPNLNLAGNFSSLSGVYQKQGTMLLGTADKGFNAGGADIINENGSITLYTAKDTDISGCRLLNKTNGIAIRGGGVNGESSRFTAERALIASNHAVTMVDINDNNKNYFSEIPAIVSQASLCVINCKFKLLQGAFVTRNAGIKFANSNVDIFSGFLFAQNGIEEQNFSGSYIDCETYDYLVQPNINTPSVNLSGTELGHIGKIEYARLPKRINDIPGMTDMLEQSMKLKNAEGKYVDHYEHGLRDDEENVIYIMSKGNITINADVFNTPKGRRMIIASKNGNIKINASCSNTEGNTYYNSSDFDGVLYAPKGKVEYLSDEGLNISGRVYADSCYLNGYWVAVTPTPNDLEIIGIPESFKLIDDNYGFEKSYGMYYLSSASLNNTIKAALHTDFDAEAVTYTVQKFNSFTGAWHDPYIQGELNESERYFVISGATLRIGLNRIIFTATLQSGNIITNEFYVLFYDENNLDTADNDNDGLLNWQEEFYDTDKNNADTDGDGLKDGFEVSNSRTNPLTVDTDNNNIPDGQEDFDKDGLTNLAEQQYNTDCYNEDTDNDGLTDLYEITAVYTDYDPEIGNKTDPANPDTDGDGVNDGQEVNTLGTSPVKYNNTFTHEFSAPEAEKEDIKMSVYLSGVSGQELSSLTITPYESEYFLTSKTPGYLGKAYDIDIEESAVVGEKVKVSFDYPAELEDDPDFKAAIYSWDGESQTLNKIDSDIDESDIETYKITATVRTTTTYVLLNETLQNEVWDRDFLPKINSTGDNVTLETAILIDKSGSMSEGSYFASDPEGIRFNVVRNFVNDIYDLQNSITKKTVVIGFGNEVDEAISFSTTKSTVINRINRIESQGNDPIGEDSETLMGEATARALNLFSGELPDNTLRIILMFTDGIGSDVNWFENNDYAAIAAEKGVSIITFDLENPDNPHIYTPEELEQISESKVLLKEIAKNTGGQYYRCSINSLTDKVTEKLEYFKTRATMNGDSNNDGISDAQTKEIFDGVLRVGEGTPIKEILTDDNGHKVTFDEFQSGGSDYDGDGLKNGDEIYVGMGQGGNVHLGEPYVVYHSSPVRKDTDGDGLDDNEDYYPNKYEYVPYLDKLCDLAKQYKKDNESKYSENELVLHYIRYAGDKYIEDEWKVVAGIIDEDFIDFVNSENENMLIIIKNKDVIKDPVTGKNIDFHHLIATLNGLVYDTKFSDTYKSLIGEGIIDDLAGWAGDLQQMIITDMYDKKNKKFIVSNYDEAKEQALSFLGSSSSAFSLDDFYADVDAIGIKRSIKNNKTLNEIVNSYYSDIVDQETRLEIMEGVAVYNYYISLEQLSNYSYTYTLKYYLEGLFIKIEWPLLKGIDGRIPEYISLGVADAFKEFVYNELKG